MTFLHCCPSCYSSVFSDARDVATGSKPVSVVVALPLIAAKVEGPSEMDTNKLNAGMARVAWLGEVVSVTDSIRHSVR